MRVFVSSVIGGLELYRDAASAAVESLGYTVLRSEEFGASSDTPRRACMEAARTADLTVVLLGERYGELQDSGLSATHEEFREACDHGGVIAFVQADIEPEPRQAEFLREAQDWVAGRLTDTFTHPDDLRSKVTRALHEHALREKNAPLDPSELIERARSRIPGQPHQSSSQLHVIVAGGPRQELISPSTLDDPAFAQHITQHALFGPEPVFTPEQGTRPLLEQGHLRLQQDAASIVLSEDGTVVVSAPAVRRDRESSSILPAIIEEDIRSVLGATLRLIDWLLDEVDPLRRVSHVVVLGAIEGGSMLGWRTRAERATNPNVMTMPMRQRDLVVVPEEPIVRSRAQLHPNLDGLVDDLLTRFRREFT